jgi:histidine triad (HIT) family protein
MGNDQNHVMRASRPDAPCPFCEIVDGISDGRAAAHVVFEDEFVVAFLDRSPLFHGHTLVVPRQHVVTFADLPAELTGPFWRRVQHISRELPVVVGAEGTFVANNNVVSQSVAHLHVHVVPRRRGDGLRGFFWPRTKYSDGEAAVLAARLRDRFGGFTDS